ncbi:DUF5053 domain-containing protein [uncultured Rikenella sp.]|uniref:DUF5053 domain-containing protein n=1 Tax=uncultured Rikenella sp. TaxID=368003 RepID=UPI002634D796|nr:DUF5053 domain-containing protein [uncultured Rikenella sp.]
MANSPFRAKLSDILVDISWGNLSKTYFGKSPSWLYHKLDGIDGNGGEGGFSEEELSQFKGALCDLADRIRRVADSL